MADDLQNAEGLIDFLRVVGVTVDFGPHCIPHRLVTADAGWRVVARRGQHRYELTGELLNELALELGRQLGVHW